MGIRTSLTQEERREVRVLLQWFRQREVSWTGISRILGGDPGLAKKMHDTKAVYCEPEHLLRLREAKREWLRMAEEETTFDRVARGIVEESRELRKQAEQNGDGKRKVRRAEQGRRLSNAENAEMLARVRYLVQERKLTQQQVANEAGFISDSAVSALLTAGGEARSSINRLSQLRRYMGAVELDFRTWWSDNDGPPLPSEPEGEPEQASEPEVLEAAFEGPAFPREEPATEPAAPAPAPAPPESRPLPPAPPELPLDPFDAASRHFKRFRTRIEEALAELEAESESAPPLLRPAYQRVAEESYSILSLLDR